jgi:hypothetical protein
MTEQHTQLVMTQAFQRGLSWGVRGIFRGNLCVDHSEEGIVEIIQNLIDFALEGNLTEELLRQDVGIVVGYANAHPEEFIRGLRSSCRLLAARMQQVERIVKDSWHPSRRWREAWLTRSQSSARS